MDLQLKGKIAIVTGASSGIGRAVTFELAQEGCDLAICARGVEELEKTRDKVVSHRVRCLSRRVDVTLAEEITDFVGAVEKEFGGLDILVNNAGRARAGGFTALSEEDLFADYEVKVMAQARMVRATLNLLERSRAPRVININAIAGRFIQPGLVATAMHRAACFALNKALAIELGPKGVLVNSVNPGFVLSGQYERHMRGRLPAGKSLREAADEFAKDRGIPLGRVGLPEEVAAVVAFLASARASYVTGASIDVGGGQGPHF